MVIARRACLWLVSLHTIVAFVHNQSHRQIDIALSNFQSTFALIVIVVAPPVAAAIIWRGRPRLGSKVLVLSFLASLIFGVVNHFIIDSPDQLARIPTDGWGQIFTLSAYALALTELMGVLAGAALLRTSGHVQSVVSETSR